MADSFFLSWWLLKEQISHFFLPSEDAVLGVLLLGVVSLLVPGCGAGGHGLGNLDLGGGLE